MTQQPNEHAQALAAIGASKGGKARAERLTREERQEIARRAAESRWGQTVPRATHTGTLEIGELSIPCAVLEDGTRVLSERGVTKALGGKRGGAHWRRKRADPDGANLPVFISAGNLEPHIGHELRMALTKPIQYRPSEGGGAAHGVEATLLPKICDVWLRARDAGTLLPSQLHIAVKADILMRGLAQVGIIALVDEATGYQEVRSRQALEQILERYIRGELGKWAKTFPDEFYQEMFRLRGWQYSPLSVKRPQYVGHLTNDVVYARLAPGVLDELRVREPSDERGRRRHRFHQWLTDDIGHPRLREHLIGAITLMRASTKWSEFSKMLQRVFPKIDTNLEFPGMDDLDGKDESQQMGK